MVQDHEKREGSSLGCQELSWDVWQRDDESPFAPTWLPRRKTPVWQYYVEVIGAVM